MVVFWQGREGGDGGRALVSIFSFLAGMFLVAIVCPFFVALVAGLKKKGIVSPLCCLHFKLLKPLSSITSHKEIKNRVKPNRPHCSCELNFFSRTLQYTFKTSLRRNKNNQDKKILQSTHSSPVTCMRIETFLVFYPCKNILMAPEWSAGKEGTTWNKL